MKGIVHWPEKYATKESHLLKSQFSLGNFPYGGWMSVEVGFSVQCTNVSMCNKIKMLVRKGGMLMFHCGEDHEMN